LTGLDLIEYLGLVQLLDVHQIDFTEVLAPDGSTSINTTLHIIISNKKSSQNSIYRIEKTIRLKKSETFVDSNAKVTDHTLFFTFSKNTKIRI
jgi:hypothetical protein